MNLLCADRASEPAAPYLRSLGRSGTHVFDRAAHAEWGGATLGLGSAVGGYLGYAAGAAAVGALIGAAPALPIAGAAMVVGGMAVALVGSEAGQIVGGIVRSGGEKVGRAVVGGAKKVLGWFH